MVYGEPHDSGNNMLLCSRWDMPDCLQTASLREKHRSVRSCARRWSHRDWNIRVRSLVFRTVHYFCAKHVTWLDNVTQPRWWESHHDRVWKLATLLSTLEDCALLQKKGTSGVRSPRTRCLAPAWTLFRTAVGTLLWLSFERPDM